VVLDSRLARNNYLIVVLIVAGGLLFANLGNAYLWQDEAETAMLAKNLLAKGYPSAWDGKNLVTQNAGLDSNESHVWTWSPWLQFYVAAFSFMLFGVETYAARLPFALMGLASVVLFYFFAARLTQNEILTRLSTLLFITSIPFLLHTRQARWYVLAVFATIWLLYAYLKLREREKGATLQIVLSATVLFHSSLVTLFGVAAGIFLHYLGGLFFKAKRPEFRSLVVAVLVVAVLTIPWIIYTEAWDKSNVFEEYSLSFFDRLKLLLGKNITNLNSYFFPFLLIPVFFWRRKNSTWDGMGIGKDNFFLLLLVVLATVAILSVLPWAYFRYLIGLVPVCVILLGLVVWRVWDFNKAAAGVVLALLVFSNVFTLPLPPHQLKFDFPNFLHEITHDYDDPNEGIVRYLQEHGNEEQFLITNYGQLPVMFYTGMRAIGFGQDLRVPEQADWIIPRQGRPNRDFLRYLARQYQPIIINYPDIAWGNRPDPFYHRYRTVTDAPSVVIYKRR
jgi:hypothetical protein